MALSNSNALGLILGPAILMAIIESIVKKKDHPIVVRKGISQVVFNTPFSALITSNAVYSAVS